MNEQPAQEDIDSVLKGIEVSHTVDQANAHFFRVDSFEFRGSDFHILPGGELLIYTAHPCPHGEPHAHQLVTAVFARGEWSTMTRTSA